MSAIQLLHAEAGSAPSGTGSFNYFMNFTVVAVGVAKTGQFEAFYIVEGAAYWLTKLPLTIGLA